MNLFLRITRVDPRDTVYGLFVQFEEKIEVRNSNFVIDEITLMTRIGGIIGVGKEMVWIIVISIGILKMFLNQFKPQ